MKKFEIVSNYQPAGDQPRAIADLVAGINRGDKFQTLLGVTGSGKSLGYEESVFIVEKDGELSEGKVVDMGPLVDSVMDEYKDFIEVSNDSEVLFLKHCKKQYYSQSFDPATGKVSLHLISAFTRHEAPNDMYNVQTLCGRSAVMTGDHNLWVLRQGKMTLIDTKDATENDYIPLPERLLEADERECSIDLMKTFSGSKFFIYAEEVLDEYVKSHGSKELVSALHRDLACPFTKLPGPRHTYKQFPGIKIDTWKHVLEKTNNLEGLVDGQNIRIGTRSFKKSVQPVQYLNNETLRVMGLYIAEGHGHDRACLISNYNPMIRAQFEADMQTLDINYLVRKSSDYCFSETVWAHLLRKECGTSSFNKKLPSFWASLDNDQLATMLRAYFDGDGYVEKNRSVTCTTGSKQLADDLAYALLRFGIWARIRKMFKRATNSTNPGNWFYEVNIYGQDNLNKFGQIGFSIDYKQKAYEDLLGKIANSNFDVVPLDGQDLAQLRRLVGATQLQVANAVGLKKATIRSIERMRRRPQRTNLIKILNYLKLRMNEQAIVQKEAHALYGELFRLTQLRWSQIKFVEKVEYKHSSVYDFTVPGAETFLGGMGGMFVHNTFTASQVIEKVQKPTLVIAHNKTLAAQLCNEFREFFPNNVVEYFVSYYDYYQPEAYVPSSDMYIEKDSAVNEDIDRLRHAATSALLTRRDVIIVASVSCIFGLGSPQSYRDSTIILNAGEEMDRDYMLKKLIQIQYQRNDIVLSRGNFRVRGDVVEVQPSNSETAYRISFFGDEVEEIVEFDPLSGKQSKPLNHIAIFPASHYVANPDEIDEITTDIEEELRKQIKHFDDTNQLLESHRIKQRTEYDLEMMRNLGYCNGIENYSRYFDHRKPGETPNTLLSFFPDDFLLIVDESHNTIPQIGAMFNGDRARKETLANYGFRLPSALDNRPLRFDEFLTKVNQAVFVSATPGLFEVANSNQITEQIIRPTGLVDPPVEIRPIKDQMDDLMKEAKAVIAKNERVLVTTLTKKMAEDLTDYLVEHNLKVKYLHSDIDTLERIQIIRDLRLGNFDILVGVNLLREGLDLPEVSLVAILDADKEGFLRGKTALVQTIGRAARNSAGRVIMYADRTTNSMSYAISETNRRRKIQMDYNKEHNINPLTISKGVSDIADFLSLDRSDSAKKRGVSTKAVKLKPAEKKKRLVELEEAMFLAAEKLNFEEAARLRDEIKELASS